MCVNFAYFTPITQFLSHNYFLILNCKFFPKSYFEIEIFTLGWLSLTTKFVILPSFLKIYQQFISWQIEDQISKGKGATAQ